MSRSACESKSLVIAWFCWVASEGSCGWDLSLIKLLLPRTLSSKVCISLRWDGLSKGLNGCLVAEIRSCVSRGYVLQRLFERRIVEERAALVSDIEREDYYSHQEMDLRRESRLI